MNCKNQHQKHAHIHGPECGHTAIRYGKQTAYLHDGHIHLAHADHFDEVTIEVDSLNVDRCTPNHACAGHEAQHSHGAKCGHQKVPHGDHMDYLVGGHLHHAHGTHCDDHGPVEVQRGVRATQERVSR